MPHANSRRLATLATFTAATLLAGCATPIAQSVVEANLAQELAANKLLLLNIARAHERMPMHFSQIGQIRAAPGGWGLGVPSLGLSLPFGGAAKPEYTLTTSNDGSSPVDVSALTNQEFMRGITTPVPPETLGYFFNQGWSKPLLMHVLFESVTQDGRVLRNDPGAAGYAAFRAFVEQASACELALDSASSTSYLSSAQPAVSVRDGVRAAAAKLDIVQVTRTGEIDQRTPKNNDHFRLAAASKDAVLSLKTPPAGSDAQRIKACGESPKPMRLVSRAGKGATDETSVVLRSPQAALFYLGQLSHAQNNGWYVTPEHKHTHTHQNDGEPLLTIRVGRGGRAALFNMSTRGDVTAPAVTVRYADHTFDLPRYDGDPSSKKQDRSMTVLSLMQLILGLQDKGAEAPGASSVRLVR